ncbi:sulfatase [Coraliomargarita sp. W4R72]
MKKLSYTIPAFVLGGIFLICSLGAQEAIIDNNFDHVDTATYRGSDGAAFKSSSLSDDELLGNASAKNNFGAVSWSGGVGDSRMLGNHNPTIRSRSLTSVSKGTSFDFYFQFSGGKEGPGFVEQAFIGAGFALAAASDDSQVYNANGRDRFLVGLSKRGSRSEVEFAGFGCLVDPTPLAESPAITLTDGNWYKLSFDLSYATDGWLIRNLMLVGYTEASHGKIASGESWSMPTIAGYSPSFGNHLGEDTEAYAMITGISGRGLSGLDNVSVTSISSEMHLPSSSGAEVESRPNVLFIISDDLTATALGCYGNEVVETPNIDRLADSGVLYTRAYCQFPVCWASRTSLMTGYYPHAKKTKRSTYDRQRIGTRATWSQYFINNGYHAARVSKIYHMGVPIDIVKGSNGADDERSWTERFNSQGPEWMAPGEGELLEHNPDGSLPVKDGNTLEYVKADGDDLIHSDGKTAEKASALLREYKKKDKPFFLAVGFVRPHIPLVAPRAYYEPYDMNNIVIPEKVANDWQDIPAAGINGKNSKGLRLSIEQEKKAVASYYASVSFMDAQVGKVMATLREEGLEDNTIVIFTSDHGFFLGEHDFWMKRGLMEEASRVPLIIKVPGKQPAVCHSFAELIDLYPTTAELCGLEVPGRLQGKSLVGTLDDPRVTVRDTAFCVNEDSYLLRTERWAYIQHGPALEDAIQLYDMEKDPKQYTNLANSPEHRQLIKRFKEQLVAKLDEVAQNDLD